MSDSPGLVDFAIGLVNSVIRLPDGQVKLFVEFKLQKNCEINLLVKTFVGLVEMMLELVNVSFSLPEWQAVKMIFLAPWTIASHAGVFRGARISSLPREEGRDEIRVPLKTPAWEAIRSLNLWYFKLKSF